MTVTAIRSDNDRELNVGGPFGHGTSQDVTTSGTSAQSAAVGSTTKVCLICATAACRYRTGTSPTAVATDAYLPANEPRLIPVTPGDKIAAIQESAGGKLNIVELT